MAVLEAAGLTTRYGSIAALRDASLTVEEGEIVGLVGPNGAGKTTLLNSWPGCSHPPPEESRWPARRHRPQPRRLLRAGLALVPERRRLFVNLTVEENLKIGGITASRREREERLDEMTSCSRCWRQVGRRRLPVRGRGPAVGHRQGADVEPRLLIMDEPSLGLAPMLVDLIFHLVAQRAAGVTLLVVEQNATRMLRSRIAPTSCAPAASP